MGYYYGFRPYVSVAERRRQAQREIEKKRKKGLVVLPVKIDGRVIAKTFWGKAWCDNLESYSDFENRLPRGRTYVRNGSVVHLEVRKGKISALVSGSELYSVEITIASLPQTHWKHIKTPMRRQDWFARRAFAGAAFNERDGSRDSAWGRPFPETV